jgi:hypothetical protein
MGVVSTGGGFSPGPLIVEVTPVAVPSCTTSYCCFLRARVPLPRQPNARMHAAATIPDIFFMARLPTDFA